MKLLKPISIAIFTILLAVAALIGLGLRKPLAITSFVSPLFSKDWNPTNIKYEEVWIPVSEYEKLNGWLLTAKSPIATILFMHGAGGNITGRVPTLQMMQKKLGVNVLIFDYRGYGKSKGKCTEDNILEDALSALFWLAKRLKIKTSQIVLYGHSLGSMVAAHVAAKESVKGLIISAAPFSLEQVMNHWFGFSSFLNWNLNPGKVLPSYSGPLLMMNGELDPISPPSLSRKLFEVANSPKKFVLVEGFGHDGLSRSPIVKEAVAEFLHELAYK